MKFRDHLLGLLVLAFGLALLLPFIAEEPIRSWDDAGYVSHAQQMREFDKYVFTVSDKGKYTDRGMSKPPLFLWTIIASLELLGNGLVAQRLPSAISTALIGFFAFWYVRRAFPRHLAGAVGGTVGAIVAVTPLAAVYFGRATSIEPLLVAWIVLSLWLYAEAMCAGGRRYIPLAVGAGLAIGGAFLTKQVACATAVFAVVLAEAFLEWRRWRKALLRLVLAGLPALVVSGAWVIAAYREVGSQLWKRFIEVSVQNRVSGFSGKQHYSWLNRMADELDKFMDPYPWEIATFALAVVTGVALFTARSPAVESDSYQAAEDDWQRARAFMVVLSFYAFSWMIVYGVISKSLLKWYTVGFTFPLAVGLGLSLALPLSRSLWRVTPMPGLRLGLAGLGVSATIIAVSRATEETFPRIVLMLLLCAIPLTLALFAGRQWLSRLRAPRALRVAHAYAALFLILGISTIALALRHGAEPHPLHLAAQEMHSRNLRKIWLPRGVPDRPVQDNKERSLFGSGAVVHGKPPWHDEGAGVKIALVERLYPSNLRAPPGIEIIRFGGGFLAIGDLSKDPLTEKMVQEHLRHGPLSIEAEHMRSKTPHSLTPDEDASGGMARSFDSPFDEVSSKEDQLSIFDDLWLPAGKYSAKIRLKCTPPRWVHRPVVARIEIGGRASNVKRNLRCPEDRIGEYHDVTLRFTVPKSGDIKMRVLRRRGSLSHDVTVIELLEEKQPRKKAKRRKTKRSKAKQPEAKQK